MRESGPLLRAGADGGGSCRRTADDLNTAAASCPRSAGARAALRTARGMRAARPVSGLSGAVRFRDSDERFSPELFFLRDGNSLHFTHDETLLYLPCHITERIVVLAGEAEKELAKRALASAGERAIISLLGLPPR